MLDIDSSAGCARERRKIHRLLAKPLFPDGNPGRVGSCQIYHKLGLDGGIPPCIVLAMTRSRERSMAKRVQATGMEAATGIERAPAKTRFAGKEAGQRVTKIELSSERGRSDYGRFN